MGKTLAERIVIEQAAERGEPCEWMPRLGSGAWFPCNQQHVGKDWVLCDYRVAPKPKKKVLLRQAIMRMPSGAYLPSGRLYADQAEAQRDYPAGEFAGWSPVQIEIEVEE